MSIGKRIHQFRLMRGMTQKYLGMKAGFSEKTADIRIAQYESGTRVPKAAMIETLAGILEVSPQALTVPDIDTDYGLIQTLFALEDSHGLTPGVKDNVVTITIDWRSSNRADNLNRTIRRWAEQLQRLRDGEITKEKYDQWRYSYPDEEIANN